MSKMDYKGEYFILVTVKDITTSEKHTVLMVKEYLESFRKGFEEKDLKNLTITWKYFDYVNDRFNMLFVPPNTLIDFGSSIRFIDLMNSDKNE